jgi:hypothetical protein
VRCTMQIAVGKIVLVCWAIMLAYVGYLLVVG